MGESSLWSQAQGEGHKKQEKSDLSDIRKFLTG